MAIISEFIIKKYIIRFFLKYFLIIMYRLFFLIRMFKISCQKPVGIVIGSKMHPDSQVEYPPLRKIMSTGYYIFLKIVFGLRLRDTQTGIKLFRTDIAQEIAKYCRCKGYSFDIEMLAIADKMHKDFSIVEMPVVVNFSRNKDNKSKIKLRSVFAMVRDTLRIKMYVSKLGL